MTDRELDAAVAVEVMGWKALQNLTRTADFWGKDDGETLHADHFRPSTTWDGAGLVVERMRELGEYLEVHDRVTDFRAKFDSAVRDGEWEDADTAPRAIALAALDAVRAGRE